MDRCNFLLGKRFGIDLLPYSFLSWYEEAHFVPEYFDTDFSCEYKMQKNGKLKKVESNYEESDFISACEEQIMNIVIRRWKVYGRLSIKIDNFLYNFINRFKHK